MKNRRHGLICFTLLLTVLITTSIPVQVSAQATYPTAYSAINQFITERPDIFTHQTQLSGDLIEDNGWALAVLSTPQLALPEEGFQDQLFDEVDEVESDVQSQLVLVRREGLGWRVALEGTSEFVSWLPEVPENLISSEAKPYLDWVINAQQQPPILPLEFPFPELETWWFTGGPHGTNMGSLDFAKNNGPVVASADGVVTLPCPGRKGTRIAKVRITHGNGYATEYYHINNIKVRNGQFVPRGAVLGYASKVVGLGGSDCAGSATGDHVHFTLLYNGRKVSIDGVTIGGYTVKKGSKPYMGCLVRGKKELCITERFDKKAGKTIRYFPPITNDGEPAIYTQEVAQHSDLCMGASGGSYDNGTPIIQWTCRGVDDQLIEPRRQSDGSYTLVFKHSNKCVSIYGESKSRGARIVQWDCTGSIYQRFYRDIVGSMYRYRSVGSGLCLDVAGALRIRGTILLQWTCKYNDAQNQYWSRFPKANAALNIDGVVTQQPTTKQQLTIIHTLQEGDSVAQILSIYGVTPDVLLVANPNLASIDQIQVGSSIQIPVEVPVATMETEYKAFLPIIK